MLTKEHIVVIGGGFAGLTLIKKLDLSRYDVTLVDRNNFHSFPPLFYQIASSGIDPLDITFPLRKELRKAMRRGVRYVIGEARSVDVTARTVSTDTTTLHYDRLVIAAGTTNNFFGNGALPDNVYTLKSAGEALRCRNDILKSLELASIERDAARRRRLLSFVIIGGGPAGVEIAGALGEMKRYIIRREYPGIRPDEVSITLVEGSRTLLGAMSGQASAYAAEALGSLMVDIRLGHSMRSYDGHTVTLDDGSAIVAGMVIWTAGVTGVPMTLNGTEARPGHGNRLLTDRYNRVTGADNVYAIGDIALVEGDPEWEHGHPQTAQPAMQQARNLARNLNGGRFTRMFRYCNMGAMATIGRNRAVADIGGLHFTGFVAWMVWMTVHLMSILGMRNRVSVLMSWMWSYFTYTSGARVLLRTSDNPRHHTL